MPRISAHDAGSQNICAFLDMIAHSELGSAIQAQSDDGYNVLVGSFPGHVHTFDSYAQHPRKLITLGNLGIESSAAGRYQFIWPTWHGMIDRFRFRDFEPETQDRGCIAQIIGAGALVDVNAGRFADAVAKCRHIWASLPGAGYGQHENKLDALEGAYKRAGGVVA